MLLLKGFAWAALWIGAASAWARRPCHFWIAGGLCLAVHVGLSFGLVYDWSHAAALRATALQVEAVTGFRSGGGLWFNDLFLALWIWVAWRWESMGRRGRGVWWSGFLFMGFNAAVVFVSGPARWMGLAWTLFAGVSAVRDLRRRDPSGSAIPTL